MQRAKPLKRSNVSDAVASTLRTMIVEGALPEGERINEVHLSQQLGVSRTPLREALNRMAAEGAVSSAPCLGYSVKPLTFEEFEPLYGMRAILDPAALKLAGLPSAEKLARLREMNLRIETARDAEHAMDLDDAWHMELISWCPNPILLDLIAQLMRRTRRYEIALMRERCEVLVAGANHRAVLAALRRCDMEGACEALRHNLTRGAMPIAAWLKERAIKENRK
jgi:DNA-binding GntR family transcriptional regulator